MIRYRWFLPSNVFGIIIPHSRLLTGVGKFSCVPVSGERFRVCLTVEPIPFRAPISY